jgi:hypothetical protein
MWQLLGSVISSFLLLRDFFGYLIPGAVFLALTPFNPAPLTQKLFGSGAAPSSLWLVAVVTVTAGYVAGQILVALGYTIIFNVIGTSDRDAAPNETDEQKRQRLREREATIFFYHYVYPALFNESDRRDTMTILRIGLAVALILGSIAPPWDDALGFALYQRAVVAVVGIFMFYNGYEALNKLGPLSRSVVAAAKMAEEEKVPYFSWNGQSKSGDKGSD